MPPPDRRHTPRLNEQLAQGLQRHCLWMLLGCYGLATLWSGPGKAMRRWQWELPFTSHAVLTLPLLLLALMLFCAALLTDVTQVRALGRRPWVLLVGLAAVWLAPAVAVVAAGWIVPGALDAKQSAGLLVGMALVAAMPVANSSVGWTQICGGNLALGLALVLVSISLSPWATPQLLDWLGRSLSPAERASCELLVARFSGVFFIVWVVLPTVAGLTCRYLLGPPRVAAAGAWLVVASVTALLVLNYANASLALPEVFQQSQPAVLATIALLAVALSGVGLAAAWAVSRLMQLDRETRSALLFGVSMKHTGLALLLAGAALADQRLAILFIVLATLAQHLLAGIIEWRTVRPETA